MGEGDNKSFVAVDGWLHFGRQHLIHSSSQHDDDWDVALQEKLQYILFQFCLESADDAGILRHTCSPVETFKDVSTCSLAGTEKRCLWTFQQVQVSYMGSLVSR